MKQFISKSDRQTRQIAANLAKQISSGVIALNGELGAGKTTFASGFANGLGIKEKIISPTFVLIRQHNIPKTEKIFYHIDLYRLDDNTEIDSLGIQDLLKQSENLVLIEWAQKIKKYLPKNTVVISMEKLKTNERKIVISHL